MSKWDAHILPTLVVMWLCVAVLDTCANRKRASSAFWLKGYLREHFLPKLATGIKSWREFPNEDFFEMEVPAFNFFQQIINRLCNLLTVAGEVLILALIIYQRGLHETRLLAVFSVILPTVILLKPSNGVGGAGYVFWSTNDDYYVLAALYKIAFSRELRTTLWRDGLCSCIAQEYKRVSDSLGHLNIQALSIQEEIPVRWLWDVLYAIVVEYPLVVSALILPWEDPLSTLVSMVLVQHVCTTVQKTIRIYQVSQSPETLVQVLLWAEQFYQVVESESDKFCGTVTYPTPLSEECGMKITFRNVWFKHEEDGKFAVSDASFEIPAGSLVVVVGANGSGKSSLLSLLSRLGDPACGEILIDDTPLEEYDLTSIHRAVACLGQNETMYPGLALWQNISLGMGDPREEVQMMQDAVKLGCATELVAKLPRGWDTVLTPVPVSAQSLQGYGQGVIAPEAYDELNANSPDFRPVGLSPGELQRLLATRLFARILHGGKRLIVCDECTSAVDACAEREILRNVKNIGAGMATRVLVTHRFGEMVKEADMILVMKEGRVVQSGSHETLIKDGCGEYAVMYHAQASGFSESSALF
ncbi:lipid A export ATP-binding/permease protein MsbA [Favolaschia claudopus]|uniref:Lipid A export ATP-binding/permease protein MsbA n=1 Tax=Favolaschia claudopus TaxID=2862362 RepID=A0AAW0C291_9AGAR